MRAALAITALAAALASGAGAQEPDHLERLKGECHTADGAVLGAYAGRVLWMQDGTFSGMLTIDADNATPPADGAPRTITVRKQTPEGDDDAWTITTTTELATSGDAGETDVACTLASTTTSNG